jgi:uncharacterized lipoprotein YajG
MRSQNCKGKPQIKNANHLIAFFYGGELNIARMKKLLSFVVLALVSTFVLVGCKKAEDTTVTPPAPASTNTPANP